MELKSVRIVTPEKVIYGDFHFRDGKITAIIEREQLTKEDCPITVIPGIIDTHNHGCMGYALRKQTQDEEEEASRQEIRNYLKAMASRGVTATFPTCSLNMIKSVAEVAKEEIIGARIAGIHSEGPWLKRAGEKGSQAPYPTPTEEIAKQMIEDGQGLLKLVALAPEIEGLLQLAAPLKQAGVKLSLAHTNSTYEEAMKAIDEFGFETVTHLGNAMTGLHHRNVGTLGAGLLHPTIDCELIADFTHVCKEMIQIMLTMKSTDKFILMSDNSEYSGIPIGLYQGVDEGTTIEATNDGKLLTETGKIQGSYHSVLTGVKNLVQELHYPLEQVMRMASANPARKYELTGLGSLQIGYEADFVLMDEYFNVLETYVAGKKVFDRNDHENLINDTFWKTKRIR